MHMAHMAHTRARICTRVWSYAHLREHTPRCRLAPIAADYQRLAWAIVERCGAPTDVDQRRLAPTGATVADQIGADWRRPIPTDADTAWLRPSTTMLEQSKQHTPPTHTPRFSLYF